MTKYEILILLAFGVFGFLLCLSAMWKPTDTELAEKRKPKIVHEIDGCQIYKFIDERNGYRYFTRCENKHD